MIINKTIVILAVCLLLCRSSNIVDFQYAQYTHSGVVDTDPARQFKFKPTSIQIQNLPFTAACELIDRFNDTTALSENRIKQQNIDQYLNSMKDKFLSLLTLTEKIKNSQAKQKHLSDLINRTIPEKVSKNARDNLKGLESELRNRTRQIQLLDTTLQEKLKQLDQASGNRNINSPRRMQLQFDIEMLKHKLDYLNNLKQRIIRQKSIESPEIDYQQYFSNLEASFKNQTNLIDRIDRIIKKQSNLTQLRREKSNIQSSITALDLYIKDVESCQAEKENIRKQFKNHQKINQLIRQLKMLKSQEEPNAYCDGVVKKLTQKIRTMLKYYDIVDSCASDLPQKMQAMKKQKQEIQIIDQKIAQLEQIQNVQQFEKILKDHKYSIDSIYLEMKNWKIKQYVFNPQDLDKLIAESKEKLEILQGQYSTMTSQQQKTSGSKYSMIPSEVTTMIQQLKHLKYKYCEQYAKYEDLAANLWSKAYEYESDVKLRNKLISMLKEERAKVRQFTKRLVDLREEIYRQL